jgi:hypothetical protein
VHPEVQNRVPVLAAADGRTSRVHARLPIGDQAEPEHAAVPDAEHPVPEYAVPAAPAVPEYAVPEQDDVPEGDRDVPDPDPLIEKARAKYGTALPSIRTLKAEYGIGQTRATRLRDALTEGTNAP